MNRPIRITALGVAGFALSACATDWGTSRQGSVAAESACMAAVHREYGGTEGSLYVVRSEYSEAGSLVMVAADGDRWRCLASNDGAVEALSLASGAR